MQTQIRPPMIRTIDQVSGLVLYESSLEQMEKAYAMASALEENGLDIRIESPTVTHTLASSLGVTDEWQEVYQTSIQQEMDEHL